MTQLDYLYGYSPEEQQRLVDQAAHWRLVGMWRGVEFEPGEAVLDVGCGGGAVLGEIARACGDLSLAGIDREPRQVEFAQQHLESFGKRALDVRSGEADDLPWPDGAFDAIVMTWFIEHLEDPRPALAEALRVLRSGGRIFIHETDYSTFKVLPPHADWDYLEQAQRDYFVRGGIPDAGRRLGTLLRTAGFADVTNELLGYHFFAGQAGNMLARHANYIADFLEPTIPTMAQALDLDEAKLRSGAAHLRSLSDETDGSLTQIVYRGFGRKP